MSNAALNYSFLTSICCLGYPTWGINCPDKECPPRNSGVVSVCIALLAGKE